MDYQAGDTITSGGVVHTFNGSSWTYVRDAVPGGVSSTISISYTPVPDEGATTKVDDQKQYDFAVLAGLAVGALYANTVQAG